MSYRTLFLFVFLAAALTAANWPQWRGPQRDGRSADTDLLDRWPETGPQLLWRIESLGAGYSSFAVADGTLFTQGQVDGAQQVMAFDVASGREIWRRPHGGRYNDRRGSGPRGTPTLDGERLYALGGDGNLVCLNAEDGAIVWELNLFDAFGGRNIRWGISESPLVDGDRLIVNAGGEGASVVALNKRTGATIWKSQSDKAGYSSAVAFEAAGVRQYVLLTGKAGVGLRAADGELLWRYPKVANGTANVATPIVDGDFVFLSSDYGKGCALLRLKPSNGGVEAEEVYFNRDMRNHYSSSVLVDGYLYGFSSRILTCMKFDTGEVLWRDRSVGKGQVIYADGKLFLLGEDGVVGLAEASPEGYRELSRFELGRDNYPTWTLPVIADGKLYVRDQETLSCYDVRGR